MLITADGGYRRGEVFPLKPNVDAALAETPTHRARHRRASRGGNDVEMADGRDHWYHDLIEAADAECPAEPMDSEHLLFLLYTSGTTGKPKGIMHTTGGYLTQVAFTHKYVFDLHPDEDVYWCTADIGWVTGHSYIVYGPLTNGATSVMYEGVAQLPGQRPLLGDHREVQGDEVLHRAHRHPDVHEVGRRRSRPSTTCRRCGCSARSASRSTPRRGCGTHEHIGGGRCPIVDTWWQTETGGIMISPLPGATTTKPGSATFPLPGIAAEVVDESGTPVAGATAATSRSPVRGRGCCAASGATRALQGDVLEHATKVGTSPATAPSSTTTATSGCSAGSTT